MDYRLEKYLQLNQHIFFHPLGPSSATALTKALAAYLPNHRSIGLHAHGYEEVSLVVYGHLLHVPKVMVGRRTACFRFDDLCNANLGAVDFIELAKVFHIIAVSDVPKLHVLKRNELRRFITLVDALYEHKVLALFTADCPAQELLQLSDADRASSFDEIFAFDRTLSRLLEMQSQDYVRASLELHGGGDGGAVALDRILRDLPRKRDRNQDSMGWVLRKLWHEYRLGSIDEVQNSPQGGGEADFGGEHRQVMRRSAFEVLLADVAERGVRDMKASDPAAEAVVAYVHKHSHPHAAGGKVKHVGFAQFSKELHGLFALLQ